MVKDVWCVASHVWRWNTILMSDRPTGDIIYTRMLGQEIIILNSEEVAIDLLEKRSRKYSDRPVSSTADLCVMPSRSPFRIFVLTSIQQTDLAGNGRPLSRGMGRDSDYTDDCYIRSFVLKQH